MPKEKTNSIFGSIRKFLFSLSLEQVFVIIFISFGIVFIAIVPPGWNTDEFNHAYRAEQLASGDVLSEQTVDPQTGLKAYGGLVPTNLIRLFSETGASKPGTLGDPTYKIKNIYSQKPSILSLKDNGQRAPINFSGAAVYSPAAYIEFIPIFWLGKLLSIPFFWTIMICRLIDLLVTALAFYIAIRLIPIGKWILFAVGLLPCVVTQAASLTADANQLIAVVLFLALVVRLLYIPRPLKLLDYLILAVLGAFLGLIKFVYAPVILLVLALPIVKKQYRQRRTISWLVVVVIAAIIPSIIWTHLVSYIDVNSNPQANFALQKNFILSAPYAYMKTLYYTFFTNQQTPLANIYGSFVWDSAPLPALYGYLATVAVVLSLFVKSRRELIIKALSKVEMRLWRGVLIGITLVSALLTATALYIYSTTLHQSSIVGIQSRYFIPLLPIVLLVFYGTTLKNQRAAKVAVVLLSCIVLVGAVLTVYSRLYQAPALII